MKKYLALGLLSSLLLTSCSVDWNDAKEKKIGELEKQVTEMKKEKEGDLFKKKQECSNHENDILEDINDQTFVYWKEDPVLEQIFYSPIKKSCLYVFRHYPMPQCADVNRNIETNKYCNKEKEIIDYFTKEHILSSTAYEKCEENISKTNAQNFSACEHLNLENKIKELKWE